MKSGKFFSLEICITKVLQWLQFTRPNTTFELFNFLSEVSFLLDFAPPSLPTLDSTVFRICILLVAEDFICEVYGFQKTSQTSGVKKNTRGFSR